MKIRKYEIVYLIAQLTSIFLIYTSFQSMFADVVLSQGKKKVFFVSFDNYIYLVVGLLLFSFTVYMYMHLGKYKVGKLFAMYLTFITISICLVVTTNFNYSYGNILVGICAFFSNIFLFYAIGYITLLTCNKLFEFFLFFLCVITIVFIVIYVCGMYTDNMVVVILKEEIISIDYMVTTIVTILSMLIGYKGATTYSKRQIRFLSVGLFFGILIFIMMCIMPMLAVVKVPDNNKEMEIQYQMNIPEGNQEFYPIIVFTGMTIIMIYILVKREYLVIYDNCDLLHYLFSTVYLIIGNTYYFFIASGEIKEFLIFNGILLIPLIIFDFGIWKKEESTYDSNLVEVLEDERQRISVLLHDEVLQDLIAMSHSIKEEDVKERLSTVIGQIRHVSQDLYPTIVEDLGLEQALAIFTSEVCIDYNIELEYKYEYPKGLLPKGVSLVMYRVVKELVTNAVKHSHCRSISILICAASGGMECIVVDDGCGFQIPEKVDLLKSPHMGLYSIKKQINDLKGNLRMLSDKTGSRFYIFVPLK